ncbi:serine/threonine-protein kinase [Oikeobacillus pervagus]|uniref:Serine/threonine-protein kinase PrkC n=1 Tax=Oikeobacillus pervagus TaxID=1325931 RepID=A0AAJ1T366_9BACI|nr:Stk1 family PASTA domain-containing Ser/Thr kinase [Oikeobacillus pervagus]MDQ0215079.1 serine/threonine-protein kinase [Oikeobacillus pervagus]
MLIGKRLNDRYKIKEMIGGGGMANVYLARDMILERDVAIKVLRLDFATEEEFIRRFQREAQSTTSLVHPNIVNIFDVGEEDDIYYIVMEFVDGMTLKQYIQQYSPIPVEKAIDIMKQLALAISHAHQNSIIHRDIKPQNILIDHDGNIKITDFGIAMALSATSITQTNSVLGSVHYISPEQARGGMATKKSDIYSLGIVMFELLTGRLPFSGESAVSIALKHLQSETPSLKRWNPNIPQSVENIVLKATAKDPFYRYNSVDEIVDDLSTALDPDRINEPRFEIPIDEEATKAIPIIADHEQMNSNLEETKVIQRDDQKNGLKEEKDDSVSQNQQKKKRKKWPWVLSIILLLALLTAAAFAIFSMNTPEKVEIPDVKGKNIDDAISILVTKGFKIGDTIEKSDEEIPEGKVVKTDPNANKMVTKGEEIDLYVSSGKATFKLDDYRDRQFDEIVQLLKDENFKEIKRETVYDDQPEGTIIEQDPDPREEVIPEETIITFTVSMGPEKISLIDLTEYNEKSLKDYAASSGLTISILRKEYSDTVSEGLVISQDPAPGTKLQQGDKVNVVLSLGKEEIPPKTVSKEITIPFEPDELGQPQEVQIFIEDMNHSMTEPFETFYIHEDTKKTLQFIIEKGKKAGYKVMRDQKVIIDEAIMYPEG